MSEILGYSLAQQEKKFVGIPLQMERFNQIMQGIDKGDLWIITGQTSAFKSSFLMGELILPSVRYVLEHPELDIKVFYYLLEENRQDLLVRIASYIYKSKFNQSVTESQIHGRNGEKLTEYQKSLLPKVDAIIDLLLTKIEIIDRMPNPRQMVNHTMKWLNANGKTVTPTDGSNPYYVPNNENQYVFFVVDHILDMQGDQGESQFSIIERLVLTYCLNLKNTYRVIPFLVQHQANKGDLVHTNYSGKILEVKLSPSLAELADNAGTGRKGLQVVSLFNPSSYDLDTYKGYTGLKGVKENFLYLEILKNRRGPKNVGTGVWVDPVSKLFTEFPRAGDLAAQQQFVLKQRNQQSKPDVVQAPRTLRGMITPDQDQEY